MGVSKIARRRPGAAGRRRRFAVGLGLKQQVQALEENLSGCAAVWYIQLFKFNATHPPKGAQHKQQQRESDCLAPNSAPRAAAPPDAQPAPAAQPAPPRPAHEALPRSPSPNPLLRPRPSQPSWRCPGPRPLIACPPLQMIIDIHLCLSMAALAIAA